MFFMIDFENVKSDGVVGAEYLTPNDSVIIFYSENCPNIALDRINEIVRSKCSFETYRLTVPGKNALDFCIATKTGQVFGAGGDDTVAIVSNDKGFKHIAEFWKADESHHKVIFRPSIELCIIYVEQDTERSRAIAQKLGSKPKQPEAPQLPNDALTNALKEVLGKQFTQAIHDQVRGIVKKGGGMQVVYRSIVKQFGQQLGLEIYRRVKKI